jgi:threonine dehydrogenase-like Zn-dependent dehydrogenase
MKAVVFHDIADIRLDDVPDPEIKESADALVRLTASAICGNARSGCSRRGLIP